MKLQQRFPHRKCFIPFFICNLLMAALFIFDPYFTNERKDVKMAFSSAVSENPRIEDFRRDWLRQRRARVDWQGMMESCKDDMAWDPVKWDKIHRSDASTSEIVFWDIRPAGEFSKILIQSITSDNRTKMIGGDTWRVFLRGPSKLAATVIDHHNGTYEALFLLTEPGVYMMTIKLDYSLCDGFRDPPRDWFIKGNKEGKYQSMSILGRPLDHKLYQSKTLRITVPHARLNLSVVDILDGKDSCSRTCRYLWSGFGLWTNDTWRPYIKESYNWSLPESYNNSGTLWIYGDSLARNFYDSVINRPLCKVLYWRCQLSFNWIYPMQRGRDRHLHLLPNDDLDFQPNKVIGYIVDVLLNPDMQREDSVLLLNIGIHYPISINFTTYQRLINDVISTLRETEIDQSRGKGVLKHRVKVIWKSSTAVKHESGSFPFPFLTTQRNLLFSAYAMSAMCQAGFDVIDLYPMTASNPDGLTDPVHYRAEVFDSLETMLGKYKILKNTEFLSADPRGRRLTRCIS